MIYYTEEARMSALKCIEDLIPKIASIPGDKLSYCDAHATIDYLVRLADAIKAENKSQKTLNEAIRIINNQ